MRSVDEIDDDGFIETFLKDSDDFFIQRNISYCNPQRRISKKKHLERLRSKVNTTPLTITTKKLFEFIEDLSTTKSQQHLRMKLFDVMVTLLNDNVIIIDNEEINDIHVKVLESDIFFTNVKYTRRDSNRYNTTRFRSYYDFLNENDNEYRVYNGRRYYDIDDIIHEDMRHTKFLKFLRDYIEFNDVKSLEYNASELYDAHQSYLNMIEVIGDV